MIRLVIVPCTAWIVYGLALARSRHRRQNRDNVGLSGNRRG
jgi:hypothetical protein